MKKTKLGLIFSAIIAIKSGSASASGYSTDLYSTSGIGNSYAGSVTGIHDASDIFHNPAISANLKKSQFIFSASYLDLRVDPDNASSSFANGYKVNGLEVKDAGKNAFVPAFYLTKKLNDSLAFGLAITSPFGLATKYNKNWVGRYQTIESSVATINVNPSISYKITDDLSFGAGAQIQYYKSKMSKAFFTGTSQDGIAKINGNDLGYGYNLGLNYQINDSLKFGLAYKSKIDHKLNGDTTLEGLGTADLYTKFTSKTTTPESVNTGFAYDLSKNINIAYDLKWIRWSRLKSLTVSPYSLLPASTTYFNMKNSILHSLGANFKTSEKFLVRTGIAYEKDGITDANRGPIIPCGNRIWASIGFNYKIVNDLSLDGAYLHQFNRNNKVKIDATSSSSGLYADYKNTANVFSIAIKKEF